MEYKDKSEFIKLFNMHKVYVYDNVSIYLTAKSMGLSYTEFINTAKKLNLSDNELNELMQ